MTETTLEERWRFWIVFLPLCVASLLTALESTILSTALPLVTADLKAGDNYVWFANAYLLTSTAFMPLYGQFAQVLGRRWPTMTGVAIFIIGSGISGGAKSTGALIAGRAIMGIGGAGIGSMVQLIVLDLVPLRETGKYLGIVYAVFGIGSALGPPVGGAIAQTGHWGWIFWLNLPVAGAALIFQFFFLNVAYTKRTSIREKVLQIDWVGNAILVASVVSILIALSWADARYTWSSFRIILPLVLGFLGLALFHTYENYIAKQPTIPPRMFGSRTSAVAMVLLFLQSLLTFWRIYFLPLYFQGVLRVSSQRSGLLLLPTVLISVPSSIIGGQLLTKFEKYKPLHFAGFGLSTLASGLYIDLDAHSSLAKIVIFQIIAAWGGGTLLTAIVPAIQACHPQSDAAPATATAGFYRQFGVIWGVAIPAAIFNSQFQTFLSGSTLDPAVRAQLSGGNAYAQISSAFLNSIPSDEQAQVVGLYQRALRTVWVVCTAVSALALVLVFLEKEIPMRRTLGKNDYGLKEKSAKLDAEKAMPNNENKAGVSPTANGSSG
ncbi:major facilitator superfamily domain-containing protein [Astrocystis sublimbata]|nr:major facilitator superfamily domain-containing protein [Astrocystis sublimbata]